MQIEFVLLILSILFFASILAGKAGSRFGVPALHLPHRRPTHAPQ